MTNETAQERFQYCKGDELLPDKLPLILTLMQSMVYFGLLMRTLRYSNSKLLGLNRFLAFSWIVEILMNLGRFYFVQLEERWYIIKIGDALFELIRHANFIIFLIILFRLKFIEIYMDGQSKTEDHIRAKLL